jgi:hypothetical protein
MEQEKEMRNSDRQALDQAFGLWRDSAEDGLAYQDCLRSEWGHGAAGSEHEA